MVNFKEIYHFLRFQRGSNIFQGGPTFSREGSNCLFPIETHITLDFSGGGRSGPPAPPLWIRTWYHKIKKNPGLRALAKLMLNSFWGKFGQRALLPQVEFVDDPSVYFDKLTSDQEEVTAVNFVSEDMVDMRWKYKNDFVDANSKTNVVIAAYTTAQARLKLYSYLDKLGPRALYADTDSVIFSSKHGESKPSLGDYLGDLTD